MTKGFYYLLKFYKYKGENKN